MSRKFTRTRFKTSVSGLVLILAASAARADAIQPSYAVTDLGTGNPTFSTDAAGNGIVIAPDGHTAYPFSQTSTGTPIPGSAWSSLPVPPLTPSGDPYLTLSSSALNVMLYPNGVAVAIDEINAAQSGGGGWQQYEPYYVQRNPDGSWGQPVVIMPGPTHWGAPTGDMPGFVHWLDKSGDILVGQPDQIITSQWSYTLYNMNTKSSTALSTLPALVDNGYSLLSKYVQFPANLRVLSMDEEGRILLQATHFANPSDINSQTREDLLLLTPAGVSTGPIASAPEPGSLAVMALAMAAFAAHRARKRGEALTSPS
jgi:hypothetical protein